ncbi:MAG: polyphosphate kinase 1 [Acidobacteria bacterium]|nr:MAG: polyphosphate kinase 1 [Acidobacteriota bacterium]
MSAIRQSPAVERGAPPGPSTVEASPARRPPVVDLDDPRWYLNRELSWLRFNERVLEEACDVANPLLERVNFLSIFASNLDEFFMIRVAGLRRQLAAGVIEPPADGMSPVEQLIAIREQLKPPLRAAGRAWRDDLLPKLRDAGVRVLPYAELKGKQRKLLRRHFKREIFPVLTPLASDPAHPFPHISNLSINLAVVLDDPGRGERFARLKVPQTIPRLLRIPDEEKAESFERLGLEEVGASNFVWLEEVIAANLDLLFPGVEVRAAYPFRVTRDADFEIEEDEASDLLTAMAEVVGQRHFGFAVRLEVDREMPQRIREILVKNMDLAPYQVFTSPAPLGMADLRQLTGLDRPDLKYPPFLPVQWPPVGKDESLFSVLRDRCYVLFHPYDSFAPVTQLVRDAAHDPQVLAIKITLYRTGPRSPLVAALMEARQNGKQVAAVVELKARFDEENNIVWARALEKAGVHVVYGLLGLKTHAKLCLVVRREDDGIRRYVHLSTGNYNPITARIYTDLGCFTCDPALADDVSDLFNALTGFSRKGSYRKLLVAPGGMRSALLERIEREIERHRREGGGQLAFKMNALVDKACIQALYRASQAGVKIDLLVRGICCLRPGIPGLSDTIRVTSIVGRFLEHARIYYFRNGGEEEMLVGSADLMPRNLDHRVETLFPIDDRRLLAAVRDDVLFRQLRDNQKARRLLADGTYERVVPQPGEEPVDAQQQLLVEGGGWRLEG